MSDMNHHVEDANLEKREKQFAEWTNQARQLKDTECPVFESHAHYNLKNFIGYRDGLMELMHQSGVDKVIIPAIDYATNQQITEMFDKPEYFYVYYAFGSHPKYIHKEEWTTKRWKEYEQFLWNPKCVAVGETGLDYSYKGFCEEHRLKQMDLFAKFIHQANEHSLPIILHIRPAEHQEECMYDVNQDALQILAENDIKQGAVMHCFSGSVSDVNRYMAAGVTHFGIGGKITYGDLGLEEAVKQLPESALLLETDAPYIKVNNMPMPNTSLTLLEIAGKVAKLRETTVEHILKVSFDNAKKIFRI